MTPTDPATAREKASQRDDDTVAIKRLAGLGVDVAQLANQPLPDGMWSVIELVVRQIRGKRRRWYAAAWMYGRVLSVLKSGGKVDELKAELADPESLAPLMANPEICEKIFTSGLPKPLQHWITKVLGRTNLRPDETHASAVALIDQHRSLIAGGKTPTDVLQSLEQPRVAAQRLRRARLRLRPWHWHVIRWTRRSLLWTLTLAGIAYVILLCRFHLVRAIPAAAKLDRHDAGAANVPVEESAWPLYSAGLEKVDMSPSQWSLLNRASHFNSGTTERTETAALMKDHRDAVDLLLEGSTRPRLGLVDLAAPQTGWFQAFRNHQADMALEHIGSLLAGAVHCAGEEHDWSRAIRCYAAQFGLVRQTWAEDRSDLYRRQGEMGSLAIELSKLLAAHGESIDEPALQNAIDQLQACNPNWRATLLKQFREADRDFVMHLYSADGTFTGEGFLRVCERWQGNPNAKTSWLDLWFGNDQRGGTEIGIIIVRQLAGPCLVPLVAGRDEMLEESERLSELIAGDLATWEEDGSAVGESEKEFDRMTDTKSSQIRFLPLFNRNAIWLKYYIPAYIKRGRMRTVALTATAAELYQRRYGAWPESTAALVPEILETVPLDEFKFPLRICTIKDRPVVYSIGLDSTDNTAQIPADQLRAVDTRDIQLFPPLDPASGASQ